MPTGNTPFDFTGFKVPVRTWHKEYGVPEDKESMLADFKVEILKSVQLWKRPTCVIDLPTKQFMIIAPELRDLKYPVSASPNCYGLWRLKIDMRSAFPDNTFANVDVSE